MALTIENMIDLTADDGNPAPKVVRQLSIIHEATSGELVQYYVQPLNETQGDKNAYAIGVFDKDSRTYSYHEYPDITWGRPGQRICGNRIERLGVKAFPNVGAIAFYKLRHRKVSRIVAPVNRKNIRHMEPELSAEVNPDGRIKFTITPPESPEYSCYRIVMQKDFYIEEHITYDLVYVSDPPKIAGDYECYAIGYGQEGQMLSRDSNVIHLTFDDPPAAFSRPYYMKSELTAESERAEKRYRDLENYSKALEERIRALEERGEEEEEEDE